MREGKLGAIEDRSMSQKFADKCFRELCEDDGMPSFLANILYPGLQMFGFQATVTTETD